MEGEIIIAYFLPLGSVQSKEPEVPGKSNMDDYVFDYYITLTNRKGKTQPLLL